MIELKRDQLVFSFPEIHPKAKLTISFQRTLRIPDDGRHYSLPPGLGDFPLRHVDDYASRVASSWLKRGGVMFPMYQSEAMWITVNSDYIDDHRTEYPFAIKVAAGKIDAITGKKWSEKLKGKPQNYMVAPEQPWLDGFCVKKGTIRQFIAMPLGAGYSAEEQITGEAEYGGLQLLVCPMKRKVFEQRFPKIKEQIRQIESFAHYDDLSEAIPCCLSDMGLAPGGQMKQEIYEDPFKLSDWDQTTTSRCFVHIANSMVWSSITGGQPPTPPPTAKEYTRAGLPWFDYYNETARPLDGSAVLENLKSVAEMGAEMGDVPLPENESATPENIVQIRHGLKKGQVREGSF